MSRPRNPVPTYRLHSSTGQAVVTVYDRSGKPRDLYLGEYGTPESKARYARICGELLPGSIYLGESDAPAVADVILAFWKHCQSYYGESEQGLIRDALRILRESHGDTVAEEFGPKSLKQVRDQMIAKGWSRTYVNAQTRRIVRCFKWAASEELVTASVYQSLGTLAGLRAGKSEARESAPRTPANPVHVAATLPHLPPHTRALVELLRITGMRPGEACSLTLGQIDRTGEIWVYTPDSHKTKHKGKSRAIQFGPSARAVIERHLDGVAILDTEPVFSPIRQRSERFERIRSKRRSRVQPTQKDRSKSTAKKLPGSTYTPVAVCHAVAIACRKAGVPKWSPYQLRHLVAAEVRERFGLEHARAVLGHSHASMSAHYARGADGKLAGEVAKKIG